MRSCMELITRYNPLSCDTYCNLGNHFQEQLLNSPHLAIRTTLVFAKIVGRVHDISIHTVLGSIKLIASTAMAIYSIPAAAFDSIPIHHKPAKQASRHFALALFFMADIPLSLANLFKRYPQYLVDKIQTQLALENICEKVDIEFNKVFQIGKQINISATSETIQQLQENLNTTRKSYADLSQAYKLQQELIQVYQEVLIEKAPLQKAKAS